MKRALLAGAVALGVGLFARTLAQPGPIPETPRGAQAPADRAEPPPDAQARGDAAVLHARVAQLRAEVEPLQIEHDIARERYSAGLVKRAEGLEDSSSLQVARDYMMIGAKLVGKGPELESALRNKQGEIAQTLSQTSEPIAPDELDRRRQDLVRIATELNRKKIELVGLEIHLEGSM